MEAQRMSSDLEYFHHISDMGTLLIQFALKKLRVFMTRYRKPSKERL